MVRLVNPKQPDDESVKNEPVPENEMESIDLKPECSVGRNLADLRPEDYPPPIYGQNVRVSVCATQGGRKYMEDRVHIHYERVFSTDQIDFMYFAVYDGHGGASASEFTRAHLLTNITDDEDNFRSANDGDVLQAIRNGFLKTHKQMLEVVDTWPRTASGYRSTAGTTASVCFVMRGKVYSGHVGDSAILMGELNYDKLIGLGVVRLTVDHKPESPTELERIQGHGGQVLNKAGVMRVVWSRTSKKHDGMVRRSTQQEHIPFLAVARSLGDLWSWNADSEKYVVSPDPDLHVQVLDENSKCLVLGSDGLWNVMSDQYTMAVVYSYEWKQLQQNNKSLTQLNGRGTFNNHARWLTRHALRNWAHMRADNITTLVVMFDGLEESVDPRDSAVLDHQDDIDPDDFFTEHPEAVLRIDNRCCQHVRSCSVPLVYDGAVDNMSLVTPCVYEGPGFTGVVSSLQGNTRPGTAVPTHRPSTTDSDLEDSFKGQATDSEPCLSADKYQCTAHGRSCQKVTEWLHKRVSEERTTMHFEDNKVTSTVTVSEKAVCQQQYCAEHHQLTAYNPHRPDVKCNCDVDGLVLPSLTPPPPDPKPSIHAVPDITVHSPTNVTEVPLVVSGVKRGALLVTGNSASTTSTPAPMNRQHLRRACSNTPGKMSKPATPVPARVAARTPQSDAPVHVRRGPTRYPRFRPGKGPASVQHSTVSLQLQSKENKQTANSKCNADCKEKHETDMDDRKRPHSAVDMHSTNQQTDNKPSGGGRRTPGRRGTRQGRLCSNASVFGRLNLELSGAASVTVHRQETCVVEQQVCGGSAAAVVRTSHKQCTTTTTFPTHTPTSKRKLSPSATATADPNEPPSKRPIWQSLIGFFTASSNQK